MSNFKRTQPCKGCPFLKKGGIRVHVTRMQDIVSTEGSFPCHETVDYDTEDGEGGQITPKSQMCAGFMIFHEKCGTQNQAMQVSERLEWRSVEALMDNERNVEAVFDDVKSLLKAQYQ